MLISINKKMDLTPEQVRKECKMIIDNYNHVWDEYLAKERKRNS